MTRPKEGSKLEKPQKMEMKEILPEENQQGKILLEDIRAKQMSYSEATAKSLSSSSAEKSDREREREPSAVHHQKNSAALLDDEAVSDGGDLAMMGFTKIDHADSDFMDAQEDSMSGSPVPSRTASMGPESMAGMDLAGTGHRLRHQPDLAELRPRQRQRQRRASDPYEDTDMLQTPSEAEALREKERLMQREIDRLSKQMQLLADQKDIVEGRNDLLARQMDDMKRKMPSMLEDVEKDTESLADAYTNLQHENRILKEQLEDAQSHIFSLQPYRKELTPDEVGREYDDLIERVTDWVTKWMSPYTEDLENTAEEVLTMARKRHQDCAKFKRMLHNYPDLLHGSNFPETDEDICTSIILRFLHDHIFQKICYGAINNHVEPLSFVETQMQTAVEPKRDLFSIRTWSGEAYNAIFAAPQFSTVRYKARQRLTLNLGDVFRVFCRKERFEWFYRGFETECIVPAMQLYEKLAVSVHHYYLDINPYIIWSGSAGDLETSPEFIDNIRDLNCKNLLQHRKVFSVERMDPAPSKKELYEGLTNICTLTPALYMRKIGRKDAIKEPVLVRKQQMLVAWGDDEKKKRFIKNGDKTLVSLVYHTKSERSAMETWLPITRWS